MWTRHRDPAPDHFEYVLVVALGRAGSTLIQGVLNSFEGYCIRGENENFCQYLFKAQQRLARRHVQFADEGEALDTPRHPWFGLRQVDLDALTAQSRSLVIDQILQPPPGTTHTGFKEIRYGPASDKDLKGYLEFLERLLPGVRPVVNLRNPEDVAKSSFWRKYKGDTVGHVHEAQTRLVDTVTTMTIPHVVIRYEDYIESIDALKPVTELLDQPWQPDRLQVVFDQRHSI